MEPTFNWNNVSWPCTSALPSHDGVAGRSGIAHALQPDPEQVMVRRRGRAHQSDHIVVDHSDRRGNNSRARAHLLVMPVTPFEIIVSKILAMGAVVLLACAAWLLVVVQGMLGMPIEGSIALFLAGAAFNLFATTSVGIFLATTARSMPQFALLTILIVLPLQMLSGGLTARESMPQFIQDLMLVAPTTHFVSLAQAILYRGAGFDVVWPQFLALAAIGLLLSPSQRCVSGRRSVRWPRPASD